MTHLFLQCGQQWWSTPQVNSGSDCTYIKTLAPIHSTRYTKVVHCILVLFWLYVCPEVGFPLLAHFYNQIQVNFYILLELLITCRCMVDTIKHLESVCTVVNFFLASGWWSIWTSSGVNKSNELWRASHPDLSIKQMYKCLRSALMQKFHRKM